MYVYLLVSIYFKFYIRLTRSVQKDTANCKWYRRISAIYVYMEISLASGWVPASTSLQRCGSQWGSTLCTCHSIVKCFKNAFFRLSKGTIQVFVVELKNNILESWTEANWRKNRDAAFLVKCLSMKSRCKVWLAQWSSGFVWFLCETMCFDSATVLRPTKLHKGSWACTVFFTLLNLHCCSRKIFIFLT